VGPSRGRHTWVCPLRPVCQHGSLSSPADGAPWKISCHRSTVHSQATAGQQQGPRPRGVPEEELEAGLEVLGGGRAGEQHGKEALEAGDVGGGRGEVGVSQAEEDEAEDGAQAALRLRPQHALSVPEPPPPFCPPWPSHCPPLVHQGRPPQGVAKPKEAPHVLRRSLVYQGCTGRPPGRGTGRSLPWGPRGALGVPPRAMRKPQKASYSFQRPLSAGPSARAASRVVETADRWRCIAFGPARPPGPCTPRHTPTQHRGPRNTPRHSLPKHQEGLPKIRRPPYVCCKGTKVACAGLLCNSST